MSDDLERIYKKFFDDSGNMKQSGKDIVSKGMKGIGTGTGYTATKLNPGRDVSKFDTRTITEKGVFSPKSIASTVGKAAKATRYGKIAAGVAAAGYGVKKYLESKMDKPEVKDVEKKSTGDYIKKGYGKARQSGMGLQDESVSMGSLGKGADYIKDLL